ncbi:AbgT family transporter [uncultured Oscillibacter sp.]|jgi:uncharacterized ion transporter superfamily protein YfcC|uniref:AbgT family transporter n=1 Tax=Dysosmobacter sp. TaxID=2591382 RepID=UPI002805354D|nr:AbgT family transporter [uncultured Oscillibacter sp.]
MKQKKPLNLNPFVLLSVVLVLAWLATFLITPGTLVDGVYTALPKNGFTFNNVFNLFRAIPYGIKDTANLVILVLVIGGALEIYKATGAIDSGVTAMVKKFGSGSRTTLLVILMALFSLIGGWLGWIETLIPFAPLVVAVVLALGYDGIVACSLLIVGLMGGFIAGPTNLYTVGVCNGILQSMGLLEGDNVFVGLGFRAVVWVVITLIGILYVLRYANKVAKDPTKSLVYGTDVSDLMMDTSKEVKVTGAHVVVLLSILVAMIMCVIGFQIGYEGVKWGIDDVSAIFLVSALISGAVSRVKPGDIANAFVKGAGGAISGALVIGFARAVYWVMNNANVNATIVYNATQLLKGLPPLAAAIGIVLLVSLINGLIPSGSGKGALLSPIIVPIAIELGLTSQTAVLAYQFGDGITNMFWFSYGTLMIFLNYAKVPVNKWYKFFVPLMVIYFLLSFVTLGIAIAIGF